MDWEAQRRYEAVLWPRARELMQNGAGWGEAWFDAHTEALERGMLLE